MVRGDLNCNLHVPKNAANDFRAQRSSQARQLGGPGHIPVEGS